MNLTSLVSLVDLLRLPSEGPGRPTPRSGTSDSNPKARDTQYNRTDGRTLSVLPREQGSESRFYTSRACDPSRWVPLCSSTKGKKHTGRGTSRVDGGVSGGLRSVVPPPIFRVGGTLCSVSLHSTVRTQTCGPFSGSRE